MSEHNYCVEVKWTDQTCAGPAGSADLAAAALGSPGAEGFLAFARRRGNVLLEHIGHNVELGDYAWDADAFSWHDRPAERRLPACLLGARRGGSDSSTRAEERVEQCTSFIDPEASRRVGPIEARRRREGDSNGADLRAAKRRLENAFAVVGLTERFEESWAGVGLLES